MSHDTHAEPTAGPAHRASLADLTAAGLNAGFAGGDFDPLDVVAAVVARMDECEPVINALCHRDDERSRAAAEASAARWRAGRSRGPLDGVPVTIKENIARAGVPMPAGHDWIEVPIAAHDAPITQRLEEAGAVIVGSTTMPDWGMLSSGVSSLHGITRSPLDPSLTTGGSSSGAGAAAAAGYGPIHIGSDIGGSIRLPCTWLGLAGLKPSFGRVPLDAPYMGRCAGPMARSMADVRVAMDVISAPDERDFTRLPRIARDEADAGTRPERSVPFDPRGLRIGLHLDAGCGRPVHPETTAAVVAAADRFAAAGAVVEPLEPFIDESLLTDMDLFWRVRSWADLRALPVDEQTLILPYIRQWAQGGADITGVRLMDCYHSIQEIRRRTVAATVRFDLVLSPVAPDAAFPAEQPMPYPELDRPMGHIGFTMPYNMSEQPAAAVPAGHTRDGRTIGVQIAGRRFADELVMAAGTWFEDSSGLPAAQLAVGG
ncbi:aspartyl-tRNA(Asn)/glutamyl-tRNA(Gln) amidotransferase subunit A [Brevibacterium sanguinis]|uniref:Aspartyl-tRNA(Asn)/glutamyl-tRNA(Gln) amidotransferase subunit A n=2 Tax=Brevibacterium TaxID=1696 RepID=A0A366IJ85_9MICO|nr:MULTISPECIES: amidase [Brevibacterium]RBP63689.1 aspartyl-tRNA(Asn)/glutamyl-tRNA(Gln) amidotransferase subunit A [Brevibacterium sanguinis]RBP70348.1 aspartyl-tRNA(Asn)/glutamyl-tRNA(Gln) amidotransferase subunit A [Brevibacterium celere]